MGVLGVDEGDEEALVVGELGQLQHVGFTLYMGLRRAGM